MSTLTKTPPGIKKSAEFWVDVEVPYSKIQEKWSVKYRPKMNNHMENNRLQRRVLSIYYKMLGRADVPQDRNKALNYLEEEKEGWAYNLCSQFEFSDGISTDTIVKFAERLESEIIKFGFEEEYNANLGNDDTSPNKDGLVALCQLANPDVLKNILIYHRASNRYPTNNYKRSQGGVPNETDWEELIDRLSQNRVEDYAIWHQFKLDNERFIAIEQEDRDGVERQVGNNIEEEPANLVILHFNGDYLDIYSGNRGTANSSVIGVNEDITGENYEEDNSEVGSKEVGEFTKEIVERDKQRDEKDTDEKYEYVMTDLHVDRSELPNNPTVKLQSEAGVGRAVEELASEGYDLLSDNRNIDKIKIRFEGYKFTINNTKSESNSGEKYRELVYGCSAGTETREMFEDLIKEEFGIDLNYKSSSS